MVDYRIISDGERYQAQKKHNFFCAWINLGVQTDNFDYAKSEIDHSIANDKPPKKKWKQVWPWVNRGCENGG